MLAPQSTTSCAALSSPLWSTSFTTRPHTRVALVCAMGLFVCSVGPAAREAAAHPISLTDAFVYVSREKVSAQIEVFVEDLYFFQALEVDERDYIAADEIRRGAEAHKKFLLERFRVRDVRGELLAGKVAAVKMFDISPQGVPLAELMMHKVKFELQYSLGEAPEFLTFSQHMADDVLAIPAEMRLVVKQENAGAPKGSRIQADQPQIVRFSWTNPSLSSDASEKEWQDWLGREKDETLGITSYSSIYAFLYIEDFEIRLEVLIPLLTLEEDVPLQRADDAFLTIAEQDAARETIATHFTAGNPLEVDGVRVTPVVQRMDFYGLDFKDFAMQAERRRVSMANARLGVILSYPVKSSPRSVKLTWDRFNENVWMVSTLLYAFDADPERRVLSRVGGSSSLEWTSPDRRPPAPLDAVDVELPPAPRRTIPLASLALLLTSLVFAGVAARTKRRVAWISALVCLAATGVCWPFARLTAPAFWRSPPAVTAERSREISSILLSNVYRSFDYRDESDTYDALSRSAAGPLLEELYLKIRGGLRMAEQGGAVSRVRQVEVVDGVVAVERDATFADRRGFVYNCTWNVRGTVEHWGHIHSRTNQHRGLVHIEPRDNAWRITKLELLDEKRLKLETKVRGL
ncbi:MAG: hypothetical protein QF805_23885 [Pirellulaceae bacterium]|nr:hypothetical protein [Pirellulaceae bacterium]